jgi:hypothetical protein
LSHNKGNTAVRPGKQKAFGGDHTILILQYFRTQQQHQAPPILTTPNMSLRQAITKAIFPAFERQTRAVSDRLSRMPSLPALKPLGTLWYFGQENESSMER